MFIYAKNIALGIPFQIGALKACLTNFWALLIPLASSYAHLRNSAVFSSADISKKLRLGQIPLRKAKEYAAFPVHHFVTKQKTPESSALLQIANLLQRHSTPPPFILPNYRFKFSPEEENSCRLKLTLGKASQTLIHILKKPITPTQCLQIRLFLPCVWMFCFFR